MAPQSNKIVFGGAVFGRDDIWVELNEPEVTQQLLDMLKANGCTHIDTAQLYEEGKSESIIGRAKAIEQGFTVDTKWLGGWSGQPWASRENIVNSAKDSLEKLGAGKGKEVDIFYMHCPDPHTPIEETLKAINEAYQAGGFKRFGLSNYPAAQVKEVLDVCKKNNYVMPSVYQGNYAAVARKVEDEIFPVCRENNLAFYAYSPIAGGFLVRSATVLQRIGQTVKLTEV